MTDAPLLLWFADSARVIDTGLRVALDDHAGEMRIVLPFDSAVEGEECLRLIHNSVRRVAHRQPDAPDPFPHLGDD